MPQALIFAKNVQEAVQGIVTHTERAIGFSAHKVNFDGWDGLAASAVLRAIARDPPPSLREKFDKIIHVDCSRWKSRRALQKAIAKELRLPSRIMAIFDRQNKDDDFDGVDKASRKEIQDVVIETNRALQGHKCLLVFHNGSNHVVDFTDFGTPPRDQWSFIGTTLLWTFRGRLRLNPQITEKVDNSHIYLRTTGSPNWNRLLQEEARELAGYTQHKQGINPEIATECCLYLLSLNSKGGDTMDYNWATHASTYWVCDGIIQGGESDEAWEAAAALHQQMRIEDYSSNNTLPPFGGRLDPPNRWVSEVTYSNSHETKQTNVPTVPPESSSFFLASKGGSDHPIASLPNDMFRHSDKLRVLKLCRCTFSFSSPPFRCCRSLRFLGLDACKDQPQKEEEEEKQDRPAMEFFQSLWVLDICYTDWELDLSPEIIEQMAANIREVHIKKGRIWRSDLAWRRLQNLRKLRIIEPTGRIQVLPIMPGATSLKTIVLDGCIGLEHVGPEGLPPLLESFSLDARAGQEAKISRISLAGCARLLDFTLRGPLPNLEELDLSGTLVKMLDLRDEVVQVPSLQRMILLGYLQLHAILWPKEGLPKLTVLRIDSLVCRVQKEHHQAYAAIMDMRFVQSLVLKSFYGKFCCNNDRFHLNLGVSKIGPPLQKCLIPNTCFTYTDVTIDKITTGHDDSSAPQFQPLGWHVEIGEGINNTNVASPQGIEAIIFVVNKAESLHVHDNSSITSVTTERKRIYWSRLKRCRVEKCPKLHTVFPTNYDVVCFRELETFCAADLPMAHCIWSKGRTVQERDAWSFAKLRSIHLHSCPRLTFVLPLWWTGPDKYFPYSHLPNLETLHIVYCGDLRQVFPVEKEFLKGTLEFPKLKHIYLHELPSLQQICEAKMSTPMLETIRVRGCWGLRRLPAVSLRRRPLVVDCEKDWWKKLEWDEDEEEDRPSALGVVGWWKKLEWDEVEEEDRPSTLGVVGHRRSLFDPRHSQYYKKPMPKGSILR